jgi:hypothetical protein
VSTYRLPVMLYARASRPRSGSCSECATTTTVRTVRVSVKGWSFYAVLCEPCRDDFATDVSE